MFVQSGSGEGVRVTNPAKQFNWVRLSTVPILLVTHKEMYSIYCFYIITWKMLKSLHFSKHANSKVQKPPSQLRFSLPSIIIILGGVHMRKLAPARVSYEMTFWFDIPFTWWLGHFISRHLKEHFISIKYTCDSKSQTLRMRYLFQSTGRPISHRNVWSFRVYVTPAWHFLGTSCKQM